MKFKSIALALILLAGYGLEAWGQTTSGSSGMFTSTNKSGSSSSSLTGSSFTGTSSSSGMGNSSGLSGTNSSSGLSNSSTLSSSFGTNSNSSTSFIGANANTGNSFIGANQNTTTGTGTGSSNQNYSRSSGQYGSSSQYGSSNSNRTGQQNNQSGYGNQYGSTQTQLPVVRRVKFDYDKRSGGSVSSELTSCLQKTVGNSSNSNSRIEASLQGNRLVLKGVVATDQDRDMAALIARLEPGIDRVQNDLVVKPAGQTDSKK